MKLGTCGQPRRRSHFHLAVQVIFHVIDRPVQSVNPFHLFHPRGYHKSFLSLLPRFSGAKKERIPASVEGTKAKLLLNKKSSRQKIRGCFCTF
jgi:hypothetical protein